MSVGVACPHCSIDVDESRLLESEGREVRVAAGTDADAWFWTLTISCQGCLGALVWHQESAGSSVKPVLPPAEVTRLRERLERAETEDALEAAVRREMADHMLALATPELVPFVLRGLGTRFSLRAPARLVECEGRFDGDCGRATLPPGRLHPVAGTYKKGTALTLVGVRERALVFTTPDGRQASVPANLVSFGGKSAGALVVRARSTG